MGEGATSTSEMDCAKAKEKQWRENFAKIKTQMCWCFVHNNKKDQSQIKL